MCAMKAQRKKWLTEPATEIKGVAYLWHLAIELGFEGWIGGWIGFHQERMGLITMGILQAK